jgi:hypothetical protein
LEVVDALLHHFKDRLDIMIWFDLFSNNQSDKAIYLEYKGDKNGNKIPDVEEIGIQELNGDGDFRSPESIELLKQADIVVTNPPFSL